MVLELDLVWKGESPLYTGSQAPAKLTVAVFLLHRNDTSFRPLPLKFTLLHRLPWFGRNPWLLGKTKWLFNLLYAAITLKCQGGYHRFHRKQTSQSSGGWPSCKPLDKQEHIAAIDRLWCKFMANLVHGRSHLVHPARAGSKKLVCWFVNLLRWCLTQGCSSMRQVGGAASEQWFSIGGEPWMVHRYTARVWGRVIC